eukprot:GHVS01024746.1.p1 GENE.GHVS01024746.1~~GHVS01024746.1.p1  ORF type:complete len:285 (+),score=73.13 GHVS01024746.1:22-855(+)
MTRPSSSSPSTSPFSPSSLTRSPTHRSPPHHNAHLYARIGSPSASPRRYASACRWSEPPSYGGGGGTTTTTTSTSRAAAHLPPITSDRSCQISSSLLKRPSSMSTCTSSPFRGGGFGPEKLPPAGRPSSAPSHASLSSLPALFPTSPQRKTTEQRFVGRPMEMMRRRVEQLEARELTDVGVEVEQGDHVNIKLRLKFPSSVGSLSAADETITVRLPREVVGGGEQLAIKVVNDGDNAAWMKQGKDATGKNQDSITALVVDGPDTLAVIRVRVLEEET